MTAVNFNVGLAGAGVTIRRDMSRATDGTNVREISLAAGKSGSLSTRTDASTGVVTVASGHGIVTGNFIDVYWSTGLRRYLEVTGTTATTISFINGAGDDLPSQDTAIVASKQTVVNAAIDGDLLSVMGIELAYSDPASTGRGHVTFVRTAGIVVADVLLAANIPQVWDVAAGIPSPLANESPTLTMQTSNASSTDAAILRIIWATDTTP